MPVPGTLLGSGSRGRVTWVPFWEVRIAGRSIESTAISDVAEENRVATPNAADGASRAAASWMSSHRVIDDEPLVLPFSTPYEPERSAGVKALG